MKRRGYWGEGLPASFEIIIFSLNRYLDSNGLLQNLLLFFFSFFYQVIGVYLDMLLYQQAVCLVMLVSMYQFCLSRVIHEFFRMWMEVLSG